MALSLDAVTLDLGRRRVLDAVSAEIAPGTPRVGPPLVVAVELPTLSAKVVPLVSSRRQ